MSEAIITALIGLAGSAIGALIGIITSSKLTQFRLQQLEEKVNKHNNMIERTFILEGQMREVQHDLRDIKGGKHGTEPV